MNQHSTITLIKQPTQQQKPVVSVDSHGSISAEALRSYLLERRRALLTELRELNKLLGITTE